MHSAEHIEVLNLFANFWHITIDYGFMEIPDLHTVLEQARDLGCPVDRNEAIYFESRDQVVRRKSGKSIMRWRLPLFAFMFRKTLRISDLFNLPPRNFLQIGRQVEI